MMVAQRNIQKYPWSSPEGKIHNQIYHILYNIIIFINCNCVVTRWQWLFYMYTKHEIGYY